MSSKVSQDVKHLDQHDESAEVTDKVNNAIANNKGWSKKAIKSMCINNLQEKFGHTSEKVVKQIMKHLGVQVKGDMKLCNPCSCREGFTANKERYTKRPTYIAHILKTYVCPSSTKTTLAKTGRCSYKPKH